MWWRIDLPGSDRYCCLRSAPTTAYYDNSVCATNRDFSHTTSTRILWQTRRFCQRGRIQLRSCISTGARRKATTGRHSRSMLRSSDSALNGVRVKCGLESGNGRRQLARDNLTAVVRGHATLLPRAIEQADCLATLYRQQRLWRGPRPTRDASDFKRTLC